MAVSVVVPFHSIWNFPQKCTEVFSYFADLETSLPAHFPGLQRVQKLPDGNYLWQFEPLSYSGYSLDFKFTTRFDIKQGQSIEALPAGGNGIGKLTAAWVFKETHGCQVEFRAKLELDLPVPGILKSMASSLATKEMTKLFERYSTSVTQKFKT